MLRALAIGVVGAHAPGVYHLPQIMGATVLLRPRFRPSVVTVHDLGALYCPEDRAAVGWLDRQLLRPSLLGMHRADRIVAVSEFTRSCLIRAGYDPARVTTIHHGIDHELFRPGSEDLAALAAAYGLDLSPARPIVLYVGNELPRKNLETLVAALARLKRAGVRFTWIKLGGANSEAGRTRLLQQIAAHGLDQDVAIVEGVPGEDLARFYRAATVYVQPSVWEGFGFPVLEAMACGTPVVAADAAALPEVCGTAAILVAARSADALADGLGTVLTDAQVRERLREAGLDRAARFTWAETATQTRAVYEAVWER